MRIAVVTDSTASLAQAACRERGVRVVPLHVVVDGVDRTEGDEADEAHADWVIDALRRRAEVSTSRPTPATLLQAYEEAAAGGAEAVVSVHLSSALSGTVDAARSAAAEAPLPVHVVDSQTIGMALGFAALGAAEDATAGRDLEDVLDRMRRRCAASTVRLVVHSLEPLRRGGRIGGAAALLGSALAIKPVLHVTDGEVQPLERVRTASRAIARLQALTEGDCATLPDWADGVDVAVHHMDAAERAEPLAEALAEHIGREVKAAQLSAVVGAHVGVGTVGVAVSPRCRD